MPIGQAQKNVLKKASKDALEVNFRRISSNFEFERWLRKRNRYEKNTVNKIEDDIDNSSIKNKEINEYIAASILIHSLDAWSYFSRAVHCFANGDSYIARHLFYYSELRSAMSIMAAQGVGLIKNKILVVKSKDRCEIVNGPGTHDLVWEVIEYWIQSMNAHESLFDLISIERSSLNDWFNAFLINPGTKETVAKNFLLSIGFDLRRLKDDREARNQVSYRPKNFQKILALNHEKIFSEIKRIWNLCEPRDQSGLHKLDNILLKQLFGFSFKATHGQGKAISEEPEKFKEKIEKVFNDLAISEGRRERWVNFFTTKKNTNHVFEYIDKYTDIENENYVFGMMYRSLFLLRVSSAFCEFYVNSYSEYDKQNLSFWCNGLGFNAGLWSNFDELNFLSDLWKDVELDLLELDDWITDNSGEIDLFKFQNNTSISLSKLSSFERVGLWSIGL